MQRQSFTTTACTAYTNFLSSVVVMATECEARQSSRTLVDEVCWTNRSRRTRGENTERAGETRAVVDGEIDDEGAAVLVGEGGGRGLESCKVCDADDVIVDVKSLL